MITFKDGKPFKSLKDDVHQPYYNNIPVDIDPKDVIKQSKLNVVTNGQIIIIWYDKTQDHFVILMDAVMKNGDGAWAAYVVKLNSKNKVKTSKLIKLDASEDDDLLKFRKSLTYKKRYLEIFNRD